MALTRDIKCPILGHRMSHLCDKFKEDSRMIEEQKNKDFIQLYRSHIDDIARLVKDNAKAYDLFLLLLKHMDGSNALCVSRTALSELLECTEKTVSRAIKYLKDNGWICVLKSGTSNVYIVNPDVAWTSYGNQKKYCKFQANVLLSSSENAEYLNNPNATTHFKTVNQDFIKTIQEKKEEHEKRSQTIKDQLPGQLELKDVV